MYKAKIFNETQFKKELAELKKENIITENENFTEEDYDRLIQFIKANKDFIIKKDK